MATRRRRGNARRPTGDGTAFSSWFNARARAFGHAGRGVVYAFRSQPHFKIHLLAAAAATGLGFHFGLSPGEWVAILLCIGSVLAAEAFNTALESLADALSTDHHPLLGRAKDTAAAAVLILSITSAAIAALIFWPKFFP